MSDFGQQPPQQPGQPQPFGQPTPPQQPFGQPQQPQQPFGQPTPPQQPFGQPQQFGQPVPPQQQFGAPTTPPPGAMPPPPPMYGGYGQQPYQPMPAASFEQAITKAGFWPRFGGLIIDAIVLNVPLAILLSAAGTPANAFVIQMLGFIVGLLYGPFFESRPAGATPGKMVLGTRVVKLQTGAQITFGEAFIRHLCMILSGIPCYLGYFWMLWDPAKMTWHDKLSGTVVVPKSIYPPAA